MATQSGGVVPSASTKISLGPAIMSMPTVPKTRPSMRTFLESISPLGRADRIRKPLLVIHGANDPRVPLSEAESIIGAARKNGATVWSVIAKDEGHGFAKDVNANYRFMVAVAFARSCLGISDQPESATRK